MDPSRPLSERGRLDIQNLANFLQGKIAVSLVIHSGKMRAQQTAEIIVSTLSRNTQIDSFPALNPNDPLETLILWLEGRQEDALVVGHLPYLSRLIDWLVAGAESDDIVEFSPGTLVCLHKNLSAWSIQWMIRPELLRAV